jgi:hypothetical protein
MSLFKFNLGENKKKGTRKKVKENGKRGKKRQHRVKQRSQEGEISTQRGQKKAKIC